MTKNKLKQFKIYIYNRSRFTCDRCGKHLSEGKSKPQLAYKITDTPENRKKYGADVINHRKNIHSSCCNTCTSNTELNNEDEIAMHYEYIVDEIIRDSMRNSKYGRKIKVG